MGAIKPVRQRFLSSRAAAVASGDTARATTGAVAQGRFYVRAAVRVPVQIVDFGDTDVEKHAIFHRVLATQILVTTPPPWSLPPDVTLAHIK